MKNVFGGVGASKSLIFLLKIIYNNNNFFAKKSLKEFTFMNGMEIFIKYLYSVGLKEDALIVFEEITTLKKWKFKLIKYIFIKLFC